MEIYIITITNMNFQIADYLNYNELLILITSDYSHSQAQVVSNILIKYCFIFNDELYELQQNKTYMIISSNLKVSLINKVSLLIQESHKRLKPEQKQSMKITYKQYASII
jgi:hypothetical protein